VTVIRQSSVLLLSVLIAVVLAGCNNKGKVGSGETRQATVSLQDGKQVTGTIKESSPKEMTIVGNDGITRTIPMTQVQSVQYSDAAPRQPTVNAEPPAGAGQPNPMANSLPPSDREQPSQSSPPTRTYEIPAGTKIAVRSDETIDSSRAADGQRYGAEVSSDVLDGSGAVAIPRGSSAQLVIVSASRGGRIRGASDLILTLGSVTVGGQTYGVDTGDIQRTGRQGMGVNKRTGEFAGGGTALGAIIGAIAGGGKGAAIGAGAGAGGGALTQILTKGKAVQVPAESLLSFKLDKPLEITVAN
jgi:hypothetical protein